MVTKRKTLSIGRHLVFIWVLGVGCVSPTGGAWAEINVGNIISSSLPWKLRGLYQMGLELAFDEINASGGVLGERLELVTVDVKGDPRKAMRIANDMSHQREFALISGGVSSRSRAQTLGFRRNREGAFPLWNAHGHRPCQGTGQALHVRYSLII